MLCNIKKTLLGSNKVPFGIMCIVIVALVIDTSLNKISDLFTSQTDVAWRMSVFFVITIISIAAQYFFLQFVKGKIRQFGKRQQLLLTLTYRIAVIVQSLLATSIVVVILQMIISSSYDIAILNFAVAISYLTATGIMIILALRLFSWFKVYTNSVVLAYGLSSGTLALNAALTGILVVLLLLVLPPYVESTHTYSNPVSFLPGSPTDLVNSAYVVSSIISFILTWVAAAMILHHYTNRLGRIKYWTIVSVPLIYFLTQFVSFSTGLFATLLASDPTFYGILLSVIFMVSKAAGGILFGFAFWTIGRTIRGRSLVKDYVNLSALGFALLFVSNQGIVLTNAFYPPFGLATASFMGLASYMIFVGIYSSAISVSEDSTLRQSIRTVALKETKLLDGIAMAQMEQQIQNRVIEIAKRNQDQMTEETGIQSSLSEDEMKQYLAQVIREVKMQRTNNKKGKTNNGNA